MLQGHPCASFLEGHLSGSTGCVEAGKAQLQHRIAQSVLGPPFVHTDGAMSLHKYAMQPALALHCDTFYVQKSCAK